MTHQTNLLQEGGVFHLRLATFHHDSRLETLADFFRLPLLLQRLIHLGA